MGGRIGARIPMGEGFKVVSEEYLGSAVTEPTWLNYRREWGPKISYKIEEELDKVEKVLPTNLRSGFKKLRHSLPNELFREEGPTLPKLKSSWDKPVEDRWEEGSRVHQR
ncbi:hypothetical protein K1719_035282 [Acacia pycnantha]|nr:hypothetical protein K1719_035282 [Acacia pycnantha]